MAPKGGWSWEQEQPTNTSNQLFYDPGFNNQVYQEQIAKQYKPFTNSLMYGPQANYYGYQDQYDPLYREFANKAEANQQVVYNQNQAAYNDYMAQQDQWKKERNNYAIGFNYARPEQVLAGVSNYGEGGVPKNVPQYTYQTPNSDAAQIGNDYSYWYGTLDKRGMTGANDNPLVGASQVLSDADKKDLLKFNYNAYETETNPRFPAKPINQQGVNAYAKMYASPIYDANSITPPETTMTRKALSLPGAVKYRNAQGKMVDQVKPNLIPPVAPVKQPIPSPDQESFSKFVNYLTQLQPKNNKQVAYVGSRGYGGGSGGGGGGGGGYGGGGRIGGGGGYSQAYNPRDLTGLINWRI